MSNFEPQEVYHCYIDGEWVGKQSASVFAVENPASGEPISSMYECSASDVDDALVSSQRAQPSWQALPPVERARYIVAIADELGVLKQRFARLLVLEQGKPLSDALAEVDDTIRYLTYAAEAARRIEGHIFPSDQQDEQLWISKVPFGVTVGLMAFNYPLALIGRKVGPALATGNTMVIKPHELTPITASEFCKLVEKVGLPKGVINMVAGQGVAIGTQLVSSKITQLVSVTGSIRAGQGICASAAQNITALSLELGGKAPFIVLEDANLDQAVEAAVIARFANCGQVCICNEHVLVHEDVAEEFTSKLLARVRAIKVGDPMSDIGMGPSTSKQGLERIHSIVEDTMKQGAQLACGGGRPEGAEFKEGNWYQPTVLTDCTREMRAIKEEIFGPVLPIMTISGLEEAIDIVNSRDDGLSAYLYTEDYRKFMHAVAVMRVGTIFINRGIVGYVQGYHSGHKRSGLGGEDGVYGIEGYLQKRTVYLDSAR